MLSDRQLEAAERALKDHKSRELQRRIMLRIYRNDQRTAERLQLPFRMVHKAEYPAGEIVPSIFYPLPCSIGRAADGSLYTIPDAREITAEDAIFYFTRLLFLNLENLEKYRRGDWTGENLTEDEAAAIRQTYIDRAEDFRRHPEKYDTQAHPLPPDAKERFFLPDVIS